MSGNGAKTRAIMFKIGTNFLSLPGMNAKSDYISRILGEGFPFAIMELNAGIHFPRPLRMDGGAIGICTEGNAEIVVGTDGHDVVKGCELVLLDDSSLFIKGCSQDFRMTILIYSKAVAFQAMHKFDSSFFNHMVKSPVYLHQGGSEAALVSYLSILEGLQSDTHNRYAVLIATNILRSIMLNIYDKIQRFADGRGNIAASRKDEIFDRFMNLLIRHAHRQRDVAFYANKLCISTRYLGDITRAVVSANPKQIIDRHIISEIKLMLTFSDMSVQQIADYMHFPDQSYLGRYFKHHAGVSPAEYRKQELTI